MAGGIGRSTTSSSISRHSPAPPGGALHRIAQLAIAAPRRTIALTALVMVAAGIFGVPVANSLSAGGFQDPTSESARATQLLTDKFGQGDAQLLIVVSTPDGFDSTPARAVGTDGGRCDEDDPLHDPGPGRRPRFRG